MARYVAGEVYAYSPFHQERLDASGLGRRGVRRQEDLARLPALALSAVDPAALVLRPETGRIVRYGGRRPALEMRWARFTGTTEKLHRATVEPEYKPVRWTLAAGVPVGSAAADVDRLADLGRRVLELAGLRTNDVLVGVGLRTDDTGLWQLAMGARHGGVPSLFLPPGADPDTVAGLHPTTLAGPIEELAGLLQELILARLHLPELRTLIATGGEQGQGPPAARGELTALAAEAQRGARVGGGPATEPVVVAAWAPAGARALWAECRGGDAFHTWPAAEIVQVAGREDEQFSADGDLIWSALGWRGSVLLRLATGAQGTLQMGPCPTCGRTTPRVRVAAFG